MLRQETYKDKNYIVLPTGFVKTSFIRFNFDYATFEHTNNLFEEKINLVNYSFSQKKTKSMYRVKA